MKRLLNSLFALALALPLLASEPGPLPQVEQEVWVKTNQSRGQAQARSLELDAALSDLARAHSEELLTEGYFGHESVREMCQGLKGRLKYNRRFCLVSAENLFKIEGGGSGGLAREAVDHWLASAIHRRNLLNAKFNRVGIGVAGRNGTYIFTQILSFEPVLTEELEVKPEGEGYRVRIGGRVLEGPRQGGFFFDNRRLANWEADQDGRFQAELVVPRRGALAIGQLVGTRDWTIDVEVPVPPPSLASR